jgi:hypothetical protein
MTKITLDAVYAFMNAEKFKRDNTEVYQCLNVTVLSLFGNDIAYRYNDPESTLSITNRGWFSKTTKERLNGIPGVHITKRKGKWHLNGEQWDGELIDVDYKSNAI